ncbi:MAG: M61 family metallopeptidase [Acidobacteria bacterium]|nr:M61 family metallopeptidase [Acidobacteriota bacterium]MBI3424816.1 M61 family metallopeptidase [Acidobacteriota bacterium]
MKDWLTQLRFTPRYLVTTLMLAMLLCAVARAAKPIVYTIKFPAPEIHIAEVEAVFPTSKHATIELMMPVWSPGFYRVEEYASRVQNFSARTADGQSLTVEQPQKNRWRITTNGAMRVIVRYKLLCTGRSVTTNWVGEDLLVLNGAAAFITLADKQRRPHEIRLELASQWKRAASGLDAAPDGNPNHLLAADYDTLVDAPIVAGDLSVREFTVAGSKHQLVDAGDYKKWDGQRGAQDLEKIVRATSAYWGGLPFKRYVFLNVFRQGGGGLEHSNSTLLTSSPNMTTPTLRWLSFVSHEYFHAFNVKRLRPVELGPFDYERPPSTSSLWIAEGLTTYGADLVIARAGLCNTQDFLSLLSSNITSLQNSPGRLKQTLAQASLDVWNSGTSGVGRDTQNLVSYYVKGPVVGFLLDATIQRATNGRKSLDDVMRLALKRYGGARGFTPEQFRKTAEDVAGVDLKETFRKWLASTEELDYTEALDWFGLRFAEAEQPAKAWQLAVRADASPQQKSRLQKWLGQPAH